ncbi:MAG: aminotransferase class III-fold pyridoxal phosphate-dependent enzyme, partial [Armatimonadetes bacterium]|nr:aminotransferase class III-fold pyridoxal phosphate-dependent enzyme [Armatimonadota bacterium]
MDADALHAHVVEGYQEHLNPLLARLMNFAGFGVEMRAEGCYIWDHDDRKFLDCLGGYGVFSLGHRHPKVIEAVKAQLDKMPMSSKVFFSPVQAELAVALSKIAPEGLQFTFFSNSGAEAVEAALKFAKGSTKRSKFVSTEGSYHGKTLGALSTTGREKYRKAF